jgi:citronellol/citronellal dehydrogenase
MTWNFEGETTIVTGGARGIGRAIAGKLARRRRPCPRGPSDRPPRGDDRRTARWGIDAEPIGCDVAELDDVADLVERTVERFGGLDVLVKTPASAREGPSTNSTPRSPSASSTST